MSHVPAYRHELKYYISESEYKLLSRKLSLTMEQDQYAKENGGMYLIRSLYFDDWNDSALREKFNGVDNRDKIRIRIYNMSDAAIKLECKHKSSGYICKQSLLISREECDALAAGNYRFLYHRSERFARRLYAEFATRRLRPVVLVDYTREAYVFPLQNVRVTFDKNIRTAYRSADLFNDRLPTYAADDSVHMVLEIKFNEYLPSHIGSLLQIESHTRSAISKYCMCRKYEI